VKIGVNLLNKIAILEHFCIICCGIAVLNEVYDFCQMHNKMLTVMWESHQVHCMRAFLILLMWHVMFWVLLSVDRNGWCQRRVWL